jgi:hypothetical protein
MLCCPLVRRGGGRRGHGGGPAGIAAARMRAHIVGSNLSDGGRADDGLIGILLGHASVNQRDRQGGKETVLSFRREVRVSRS